MGLSGASQRRCFGALAAGFAALAVDSQAAHVAQGTERLLGDAGDLALAEAVPGLDSRAGGPCTEGGVGGSLTKPVWVFSPQAAELVSKNWEAYEAHMQDVRDYLEARLEVSGPGSFVSPLPESQSADWGLEPGWVCPSGSATSLSGQSHVRTQSGSQPSDFSRPPLGSRGSTSTATLQAPSDSATPLTSPFWAQAFKVALTPLLPCDGAHRVKHPPCTGPCG